MKVEFESTHPKQKYHRYQIFFIQRQCLSQRTCVDQAASFAPGLEQAVPSPSPQMAL